MKEILLNIILWEAVILAGILIALITIFTIGLLTYEKEFWRKFLGSFWLRLNGWQLLLIHNP
jgi:hypothetical protein